MKPKTPSYIVQNAKPAEKTIKGLDQLTRGRILAHLKMLAYSPFDLHFSKKLNGREGERRWKVGRKWQILYEVDPRPGIINILAVRPREHAYRD